MGRTIASITQTWQKEEAALKRFKRALRKGDQLLLDELLVLSRLHLAEASYASNLYPLDIYLIAILLEVYKQLKATQRELHNPEQIRDEQLLDQQSLFLEVLACCKEFEANSQALPESDKEELLSVAEPEEVCSYTAFEEAP